MPRKQRHTVRRRAELGLHKVQVMVPQTRLPGTEAEVDFGEFHAVIAGLLAGLWLFALRAAGCRVRAGPSTLRSPSRRRKRS